MIAPALALLLADVAAAAGGVTIDSASACPTAAAVGEALHLLDPSPPREPVAVALAGEAPRLTVQLRFRDRAGRDERVLAVDGDCAARAQAVALVIAAWMGEPPAPGLPLPALALAPPPPPPPAAAEASAPAPPPAPPDRGRGTEIGLGVLAGAGGGWAPGLRLEVARVPHERGLGLSADGGGARKRSSNLTGLLANSGSRGLNV